MTHPQHHLLSAVLHAAGAALVSLLLLPGRTATAEPIRSLRGALSFQAEGFEPEFLQRAPSAATLAFRARLSHEALRYRDTNRWSAPTERSRQDREAVRARSRAAEGMLGEAFEALAEEMLEGLVAHRRDGRSVERTGTTAGFRVGEDPQLCLRQRFARHSLRLDLPLSAHDDLRLACRRRLSGGRHERTLSASLAWNPWDESARLGLHCRF